MSDVSARELNSDADDPTTFTTDWRSSSYDSFSTLRDINVLSLANNGLSETPPPELGNLVGIAVYALYTNKTLWAHPAGAGEDEARAGYQPAYSDTLIL